MIQNVHLPELPQFVLEKSNEKESVRRMIDYYSGDKFLTDEELKSKVQLWIDYIQKFVPHSVISTDFSYTIEPSSKEQAKRNKSCLINSFMLLGKNPPADILSRMDARIEIADENNSVLKIYVLTADWIIKDEKGSDQIIASLDLRFENGIEEAVVWPYDIEGDTLDQEYIYSWSEGLKLYAKFGHDWLHKFAPINVIPDIPNNL